MSNFIDWRDYTRQPHIKQLIESKGIEAARVQFIKDSNKTMWDDPFIINESYESPGTSLSNNASAAAGSNPFLYGNTAETQSFAWVATVTNIKFSPTFTFTSITFSINKKIKFFDTTVKNFFNG